MRRCPATGPGRTSDQRRRCRSQPDTLAADPASGGSRRAVFLVPHPPRQTLTGYQTKQERVAIAGVDGLVIRSLLDLQQFSDPDDEALEMGISSAAWPMFGQLWPSGAQLAARIGARAVRPGERVLEIGCGLALASLVAHRRGADVTASDWHPLAESFLAANLLLNHLLPMKYGNGRWSGTALPLRHDGALPRPVIKGQFDFVIGSDLLYQRDVEGALAGFIGRHSAPVAEVWIVDPDRGNRPAFNRRMADQGFVMREERLDQPPTGATARYTGRLLVYRRGATGGISPPP